MIGLVAFDLMLEVAGRGPVKEAPIFEARLVFDEVPGYPSCHAATIAELGNGDLLTAWYAGSREGATDVAILASRLPRGSERWTPPAVIEDTPDKSEGNPVLFVDRQGTVWLFFVTMHGDGWTQCKVKYKKSTDQGRTWGEVVVLRDELGWMTGNKPTVLKNGEILLPLYDERQWSTVVMISGDGGKTWKPTAEITSTPGNIQATVAELSDGSLLSLMRSGGRGEPYIWQATSKDRGRTWSQAAPSGLKNPNARIDLVRLSNGHLVLAFNDTFRGRTPLNVALSQDEGKTWPFNRKVETQPGEYSYPAIIQARDGMIHLVYTYRRTHIKHLRFNESWLTQI
jgi:predicted neuraminidase